tara:strand:- start:69 stop:284 length:216 start_codon:yes stop_codon:yes gene_type:complete
VGDLVKPRPKHYSSPLGYTSEDTKDHGHGIVIDSYPLPGGDISHFKVKWQHPQPEWWLAEELILISKSPDP